MTQMTVLFMSLDHLQITALGASYSVDLVFLVLVLLFFCFFLTHQSFELPETTNDILSHQSR